MGAPIRSTSSPAPWLALFGAQDLDGLIAAVFTVLRGTVPCDFASALYRLAGDAGVLKERDSRGREYDPAFMRRYAALSPAVRIAAANCGIKVIPTRGGLCRTERELRRSEFYREIMRPQGWRHAVALCFWSQPAADLPVFVASVFRRTGRRDFSIRDIAALADLHPFLELAVNRVREREAQQFRQDGMARMLPALTPAERRVAQVLAEGLSNQEIADRLGKTVHAVKFLLHRIYRRTGIPNRAALVAALSAR